MNKSDLALVNSYGERRNVSLRNLPLEDSPVFLWGLRRLASYQQLPEDRRTECNVYQINEQDLDRTDFVLRPGQEYARLFLEGMVKDWHDQTENTQRLFRAPITVSPLSANAEGYVLISSGTHIPRLVLPSEGKFVKLVYDFLEERKFPYSKFDELPLNDSLEVVRATLFKLSMRHAFKESFSGR